MTCLYKAFPNDKERRKHSLGILREKLKDPELCTNKEFLIGSDAEILGLSSDRKNSLSEWLAQVKQFYLNALDDATVIAKMPQFGLTQEKLAAGKALLEPEAVNAA